MHQCEIAIPQTLRSVIYFIPTPTGKECSARIMKSKQVPIYFTLHCKCICGIVFGFSFNEEEIFSVLGTMLKTVQSCSLYYFLNQFALHTENVCVFRIFGNKIRKVIFVSQLFLGHSSER